jgi:hypothetical protein
MKKIVSTLLAGLLLFSITISAQTRSVTGNVSDSKGLPVPYASVILKGTKQGTTADANGKFTIKAKTGDVLVVSAQGLFLKNIPVSSESNFSIVLDRNENETLDEGWLLQPLLKSKKVHVLQRTVRKIFHPKILT